MKEIILYVVFGKYIIKATTKASNFEDAKKNIFNKIRFIDAASKEEVKEKLKQFKFIEEIDTKDLEDINPFLTPELRNLSEILGIKF